MFRPVPSRAFVAAFLLVFLIKATSAGAVLERPAMPFTANAHFTRLSNGLEIVVLPDTTAPVVSTWLNVRAGSDDEPYYGNAHAQEHMFYRGSRTLTGAQADEIAGFTGDEDNADTQQTITQFFHTVPASDLDVAIHLDRSRFVGLLDAQHDWDQERGAIEQEVRADNSDAGYRLGIEFEGHLMAGTPYADDGLGSIASFDHQIQAPQLRAFYTRWYHPNNVVYVIAGDVDPAAAVASVKRFFGDVPAVPLPKRAPAHLRSLMPASFHDTDDTGTTLAMVGYRFPGLVDSDYAASVVLTDVLNAQRGALYALVASGRAIDVETDPNEFPTAGTAVITAHFPTSVPPRAAIASLEAAVAKYRANGVPSALVVAAKKREYATFATAGNSIRQLAGLWSSAVATEGRTPLQDLAAVERVSTADVDRVLRRYLDNRTATVGYAVPKSDGDATGGGGGASGETKSEPTVLQALPPWAQRALDRLAPPKETASPSEFTLANGLHVIVQPETSSESVVVAGSIAHEAGLEEPDGQAGIGGVVEALMPYGTTTYSRLRYQEQLDKISSTVKTGFEFSLAGLAPNFARGMQLLADDELHPALAPSAFATVRASRAATVAGEDASSHHTAAVALAANLYPIGDPARHFDSASEISRLTLSDVRSYYRAVFRPDLTTIAIVGNITPETARAVVESTFGAWKANGPPPTVVSQPVRDNRSASTTVPSNGRQQDAVTMSETLAFGNTETDDAPLSVASTMLSGDFSSILIRDMRVTTGYVYYVGTNVRAQRSRSNFDIVFGCSPDKFARASAVLVRDLTSLQTTPVDPDRLKRAKSRLLSSVAVSRESYVSLATALAQGATQGLGVDSGFTQARREYAVTADDIRRAMMKWIRPEGFVQTIEGPAPT